MLCCMSRNKFSRGSEVGSQWTLLEAGGLRADSKRTPSGLLSPADSAGFKSAVESAADPPTSPPESASGVESASGLVRGGQSTDPPRSRSESAADFKVRLESAGVRLESAGVRQNSYESTRNIFWRSSAGVRSESGGSARSPADSKRSPLRDG